MSVSDGARNRIDSYVGSSIWGFSAVANARRCRRACSKRNSRAKNGIAVSEGANRTTVIDAKPQDTHPLVRYECNGMIAGRRVMYWSGQSE